MPAYILALLISVSLVIIFDKITWDISLLFQSVKSIFLWLLPITNIGPSISGAWLESSIPSSLNNSLWTISFEIISYFIILPFLLVKNNNTLRIILGLMFIYFLYRLGVIQDGVMQVRNDLIRVFAYFMMGVGIYKVTIEKRMNYILFFSFISFFIIEKNFIEISTNITLILLIVFFTFYLTKKTKIANDYTYGIYLYAWPISQFINSYFPHNRVDEGGFHLKVLLAYIILVFISFLSWHFVEKKVLILKKCYKNIRINYEK